eukprot:GABV01003155.1.p1 GENE.GABV01003155.1~~GABV01003155.1.p1  ORF type:complete len:145 (+),score=30.61 GABV01003155.1:120-554(+)
MNSDVVDQFDWEYFHYTCVRYNRLEPFSKTVSLASLYPQIVGVSAFAMLLARRSIHLAMVCGGIVVSTLLNFTLKSFIQQDRPENSVRHGSSFGMPSDHAQFTAFIAVYVNFWLFLAQQCVNIQLLLRTFLVNFELVDDSSRLF